MSKKNKANKKFNMPFTPKKVEVIIPTTSSNQRRADRIKRKLNNRGNT
jgi:hypothetical protein